MSWSGTVVLFMTNATTSSFNCERTLNDVINKQHNITAQVDSLDDNVERLRRSYCHQHKLLQTLYCQHNNKQREHI